MLSTGCGAGQVSDEDEPLPATTLIAGGEKTCVVLDRTKLRCWGRNDHGRLGFGLPDDWVGDDEPANLVPLLDLGEPIVDVALSTSTGCLLLEKGDMRCWGGGTTGALGFPWPSWIGDDETLLDGQTIDFGGERPTRIAVGESYACALLDEGAMKCWGSGSEGATGYGSTENLGDEEGETPKNLPAVDVGGRVSAMAAARNTCVILDDGALKCWGHSGAGKLGLASEESIGDDETPASVPPIQLAGGPVIQVVTEGRQICALHEEGTVSCWGEAGPWLGYGKAIDSVGTGLGDDEHPSLLGVVDVGGRVVEIAVGDAFTCARLGNGTIKCWGVADSGQLGYGNTDFIGYEQTPAEVPPLDLGGLAVRLVAGRYHACALLEDGTLRCWGKGAYLGYGSNTNIGDDETPASAGPVPFR